MREGVDPATAEVFLPPPLPPTAGKALKRNLSFSLQLFISEITNCWAARKEMKRGHRDKKRWEKHPRGR